MWERPSFEALRASLADPSNPIGMRMRAAYYLRQLHAEATADIAADSPNVDDDTNRASPSAEDIVAVLSQALLDKRHGSLLRHELAYVMGQLRDERCCPTLEQVLRGEADTSAYDNAADVIDCAMVRHECAEALGAIGANRSELVLQLVLEQHVLEQDTSTNVPVELAETCRLALDVMQWRRRQREAGKGDDDVSDMPAACACMLNPYSTIDPAPPHPTHADMPIEAIGDVLCDANLALFERYRAMFSLRNIGGEAAVLQLCRCLVKDETSALLRHEVAYVLGQMQHPASIDALEQSLRRTAEHAMVRHESAEALGAIDGHQTWTKVERILLQFVNDEDDVIRESCLVALDAADYWGHGACSTTSGANEVDGNENSELETSNGESSFAKQKAEQRLLVNHFNLDR